MTTANPLDILLDHDVWATRQIIDACSALSPEQFHRSFEMGPGSLHDTVLHMLAAMQGWGDLLADREVRFKIDPNPHRTTAELRSMLDAIAADFARSARAHPLDEHVTRVRDGKMYSFPRGGVITHVTTHGMHHRAQCLNMLRHVGVQPLPPSSVVEWMRTIEGMH